jgi:hypothetical protein
MSPIAAMKVAAVITFTPRHRHQPADLGRGKGLGRDRPLDLGDLRLAELELAQAAVDGLALGGRQLDVLEPAATLDPEQIADRGLPISRRINAAWISFLAFVRTRISWLRR